MEKSVDTLSIIGFLALLDKEAVWYEHTASSKTYRIVYWDDIVELAKQFGIEVN